MTQTTIDFDAAEKILQMCIDNYEKQYRANKPNMPAWNMLSENQQAALFGAWSAAMDVAIGRSNPVGEIVISYYGENK